MDKIKSPNIDLGEFQPDHLRPIPTVITTEFPWIDNLIMLNVQWNYTLEVNLDKMSQVKEIIQKTCNQEVSDEEQKLLFDFLQNDKDLLKNCGFNTQKLPYIIEKNKEVAQTLLLLISNFDGFEDYLDVFPLCEVTQNTLEVFAKVQGLLKLPPEYITHYIKHCIEFSSTIKEKQHQNRIVRYVSVFIQQLVKIKAFPVKDALTEVRLKNIQLQAFCIEFSKVGEVSKLFKIIKQLEQGGQ